MNNAKLAAVSVPQLATVGGFLDVSARYSCVALSLILSNADGEQRAADVALDAGADLCGRLPQCAQCAGDDVPLRDRTNA